MTVSGTDVEMNEKKLNRIKRCQRKEHRFANRAIYSKIYFFLAYLRELIASSFRWKLSFYTECSVESYISNVVKRRTEY